jgi:hypothetical protein
MNTRPLLRHFSAFGTCLWLAVYSCQAETPKTAGVNPALLPASTATVPGVPPVEGVFTLAVMPDTQYYSEKYPEIFYKQTQWIADNLDKYHIKFVFQLGDITETAADVEWEVASKAFATLDGRVPYSLTPGNHDYGGRLQTQTHRSPMSNFFTVPRFQKMTTFGGVYDKQPDKSENHFHPFEAGGRRWLVIALEFAPRNDVLRWAGEVAVKHPRHSAIIITHAYLDPSRNARSGLAGGFTTKTKSPADAPAEPVDMNFGVGIWEKLASQHANIAMVLCGHACYTSHKTDKGIAGNTVHEVVVDYQKDVKGGNGWMRLLQFLPDGKTVRSRDFSPVLDLTCTMPDRSYDMEFAPIK